MKPWLVTILTLFPEMFPGPLDYALAGKGLKQKIWNFQALDIRNFATDKHKTVDDTCFGGGAGMVLKPDVIHAALTQALRCYLPSSPPAVIYLSPRGVPLTQKKVRSLTFDFPSGLILLCGRYEGIDQRVIDHWRHHHNLQEISMGDYILAGGEMAALTIMDACIRLLPGIVHNKESLESESFELDLLEFPHYTKPRNWQDKIVPDVLLSGDHKKIAVWHQKEAEHITQERRPDLWQAFLHKNQSSK